MTVTLLRSFQDSALKFFIYVQIVLLARIFTVSSDVQNYPCRFLWCL